MKKIILLVLLALISVSAFARKSYITVYSYGFDGVAEYSSYSDGHTSIKMTGDVPDNIEAFVRHGDITPYWYINSKIRSYSLGQILNVLSEYGYEVESITHCGSDNKHLLFLLSKEISSGQTISKGDVNTDGEVNIADVNEVISLILGIVREHPEILEQIKKQTNH